jgi:hypothetical protein
LTHNNRVSVAAQMKQSKTPLSLLFRATFDILEQSFLISFNWIDFLMVMSKNSYHCARMKRQNLQVILCQLYNERIIGTRWKCDYTVVRLDSRTSRWVFDGSNLEKLYISQPLVQRATQIFQHFSEQTQNYRPIYNMIIYSYQRKNI